MFVYIGASTANFYPMPTEKSLDLLIDLGFQDIEVFVNTESEIESDFLMGLKSRADAAGVRIRSLHPYLSVVEPYLLFSHYERRFEDGCRLYKRLFQAAHQLGAEIVVMHGDREESVLSEEESIRRYEKIYDIGQEYGVTLAQENVWRYRSSQIGYLSAMRQYLGPKAHFVFDLKQSLRCGLPWEAVLDAMGEAVCHLHVSDHMDSEFCLVPGQGVTDYRKLFHQLKNRKYTGGWMLELYRTNFSNEKELTDGKQFLLRLLNIH